MKKIITIILLITFTQSQIARADSYAGTGLLIGGLTGVTFGVITSIAEYNNQIGDYDFTADEGILLAAIFGATVLVAS